MGSDSEESRLDLVVVGHVNIDHLLRVPRLPHRDRTVPIARRESTLGGTAANIALSASRWGVKTGLVSRIGSDFPEAFLERLRASHVDLRGVERVNGASSSACIIVHDSNGDQMTLIDQGPMRDARRAPVPTQVLRGTSWVHLTTGDPAYIRRIQDWSRRHALRTAVDPAQEIHYRWNARELRELLAGAELFFGNESEVGAAARMLRVGPVRALTNLVPLVVMTRGKRGATAYYRGGEVTVAASPLRSSADPTGAGDAFRGGFYAGWFAGQPIEGCLRAGHRAAADWLRERPANFARGSRS